jgi:DNA-binding CsgD family transcriptional regulator
MRAGTGEAAAARRLDAEDATMRQVLAWAMDRDAGIAVRLAVALAQWWLLRGRSMGAYPLLRAAVGHAAAGSGAWCAAQFWLGSMALYLGDLAGSLGHLTAVCDALGDRGPSRALADCLTSRSMTLTQMGRTPEAAGDGRRAQALARELGYPAGEALALAVLSAAAYYAGELGSAAQLARQAQQVTVDAAGLTARLCGTALTIALTVAGDLAAAERTCTAGLARSREAGDLWNLLELLPQLVMLDLRAGRIDDAMAHLREALRTAARAGCRVDVLDGLECCGLLCAATGRPAEAVTVWAARAALSRQEGHADPLPYARRRDRPLREARQALGSARTRAAEDRGAAMSLATAAEYALMLTAPGPPQPQVPLDLGMLSARERELVTLVAQGHTNAQIAAQLYISVHTVHSHLDRIRDKTGCGRRADLTRLALSVSLV